MCLTRPAEPIVQAPLACGPATQELSAAVSSPEGLGTAARRLSGLSAADSDLTIRRLRADALDLPAAHSGIEQNDPVTHRTAA